MHAADPGVRAAADDAQPQRPAEPFLQSRHVLRPVCVRAALQSEIVARARTSSMCTRASRLPRSALDDAAETGVISHYDFSPTKERTMAKKAPAAAKPAAKKGREESRRQGRTARPRPRPPRSAPPFPGVRPAR